MLTRSALKLRIGLRARFRAKIWGDFCSEQIQRTDFGPQRNRSFEFAPIEFDRFLGEFDRCLVGDFVFYWPVWKVFGPPF